MTVNIKRQALVDLLARDEGADFFNNNDQWEIEADDPENKYDYVIAGPTARAFHASKAAVRLLRGPIGSGKTTAAVRGVFANMCTTYPNKEGVRRSHILVARETMSQIRTTTMRSWLQSAPLGIKGIWSASTMTMTYRFQLPDNTMVHSEVVFKSFPDDRSILNDLRGMEISGAFLNECATTPLKLITEILSRFGRFPNDIPQSEKKTCMICDTNSFDENHEQYDFWYNTDAARDMAGKFGYKVEDFIQTFDYPSGLGDDPEGRPAENLHNLEDDFYEKKAILHANDKNFVDVMLRNMFGTLGTGLVCYPSYDPATHVRAVSPNTTLKTWIGVDPGKDCCCVVCQEEAPGTINIIDIYKHHKKTGMQAIIEDMYAYLREKYPPDVFTKWVVGAVDPGGAQSTSMMDDINYLSYFHSAANRYGVGKVVPATTNNVATRIETVDKYFSRNVSGRPAIIIDKLKTGWLQRACSVYSYKREQTRMVGKRFGDKPDKSPESHIAEALQYALLRPGNQTRATIKNPDNPYFIKPGQRVKRYKRSGMPTARRPF